MCQDYMCLLKLSPTRGRGNEGQDCYILKLTSGLFLKSGEAIMIVPLDTFWNGMKELVKNGVLPLISPWRNGNVEGLSITWPDLQNCSQLVLGSDWMIALQGREPPNHGKTASMGDEVYYVPDGADVGSNFSYPLQALLQGLS